MKKGLGIVLVTATAILGLGMYVARSGSVTDRRFDYSGPLVYQADSDGQKILVADAKEISGLMDIYKESKMNSQGQPIQQVLSNQFEIGKDSKGRPIIKDKNSGKEFVVEYVGFNSGRTFLGTNELRVERDGSPTKTYIDNWNNLIIDSINVGDEVIENDAIGQSALEIGQQDFGQYLQDILKVKQQSAREAVE